MRGSTKYGLLACGNALAAGSYLHLVPLSPSHALIVIWMLMATLKLADKAHDSRGCEKKSDYRWDGDELPDVIHLRYSDLAPDAGK